MMLLTKSIKDRLVKNYYMHKEAWNSCDEYVESKAVVKLFNPYGPGDWYLSEMDPATGRCFGLCMIHEPELGYVNIKELEELDCGFGGVERDKFFTSNKYSFDECREFINAKYGLNS